MEPGETLCRTFSFSRNLRLAAFSWQPLLGNFGNQGPWKPSLANRVPLPWEPWKPLLKTLQIFTWDIYPGTLLEPLFGNLGSLYVPNFSSCKTLHLATFTYRGTLGTFTWKPLVGNLFDLIGTCTWEPLLGKLGRFRLWPDCLWGAALRASIHWPRILAFNLNFCCTVTRTELNMFLDGVPRGQQLNGTFFGLYTAMWSGAGRCFISHRGAFDAATSNAALGSIFFENFVSWNLNQRGWIQKRFHLLNPAPLGVCKRLPFFLFFTSSSHYWNNLRVHWNGHILPPDNQLSCCCIHHWPTNGIIIGLWKLSPIHYSVQLNIDLLQLTVSTWCMVHPSLTRLKCL